MKKLVRKRIIFLLIVSLTLVLFLIGEVAFTGKAIFNATLSSVSEHNTTTTSGFAHLNISDPTMLLYFAFDDNNSLSKSYDYTNNSNDGDLISGPVYVSSGYVEGGYNFSGGYDYINVSDATSLDITGNVTVSAWVNLRSSQLSSLYSGVSHVCGIFSNGKNLCWGSNYYGQLGDGTVSSRTIPSFVSGVYNFSILSSGSYHTCGILLNGTVMCWGGNVQSQLGDGNSPTESHVPVTLAGDYNFSNISSGYYFSCGVLTNGSLLCWGDNANGQLGDGNTPTDSDIPVSPSADYNFSSVSCGNVHACAILTNGSAMCWGDNSEGQLGDNNYPTDSYVPVFVSGDYNFSEITTGDAHTCGILTNSSVMCWGNNIQGYLGNGNSPTDSYVPVFVSGDYNFSSISIGERHSCGILTNGSLLCWGDNAYGQLGNGNSPTDSNIPTSILGNYNFSIISAGRYFSCGALTNGSAFCWGRNAESQLGDGTVTQRNVPTKILRGQIVGKNNNTFMLASTFDNEIHSIVENVNVTSNTSLSEGWNHIVLTYNQAGNQNLFINGVLVGVASNSGAYSANNEPLVIMRNTPGLIDEVMVFNRYLSSTEVSEIYNNQSQRFFSTGELTFEQSFGSNNTLNVSIDNCSTPSSTSIQAKTSSSSYSALSSCNLSSYTMSGDNVTVQLVSDSNRFFTPLIFGNVSFSSYYVTPPVVEETTPVTDTGGSTGTSSSILNNNYWTSTEIIPPTSWTYSGENEGDLENEEQAALDAIESGEDITLIKKILRSFVTSLTTQERAVFDVKGENVSAGVAFLSRDYAIVQVQMDQRNMTVGDLESFDVNNDSLTDLDVRLDSIDEGEKGFLAKITFQLVYQGILEEDEITQIEGKEKSRKFLIIFFIAVSFLVIMFQVYRFRKFRNK